MHIRKSVLAALLFCALAGGWLAKSIAQGAGVTLVDHTKIAGTLAKPGSNVLYSGKSGEASFVVMTASRNRAGEAEVHNLDTDVFYMLSGAGTLVTGGTTIQAKTTAPDEIRGQSIQGGESRRLTKGDVIIIPHGIPHWFKEVEGPLNYFVVKVH